MLRELAMMLEAFSEQTPLVFIIEDAQWGDAATLDAIAYLARRQEPARFLLVVTARSGEQGASSRQLLHIQRELTAHGCGAELALAPLSAAAISTYLAARFRDEAFPTALPELLYRRCGGNPLFLTALVKECLADSSLLAGEESDAFPSDLAALSTTLPATLRDLLLTLAAGLTPREQQLLQIASLVGAEFPAALVATAGKQDPVTVETICESLSTRQQFLRRAGVVYWPDGALTARYGFRHALYQKFWHEQVQPSQRQQWHHVIGERLLVAYGNQTQEIAAELAEHFAEARDVTRTLDYRQQAAQVALRRGALPTAVQQLTAGLDFLKTVPNTSTYAQQELELVLMLGALMESMHGYASLAVKTTYTRAQALIRHDSSLTHQFVMTSKLWVHHFVRAELTAADELAQQILRLATGANKPPLLVHAHISVGALAFHRGDLLQARHHLTQACAGYTTPDAALTVLANQDSGVFYLGYEAFTYALLGEAFIAQQKCEQLLNLAGAVPHWYSQVCGLMLAARLSQLQHTRLEEAERWAAAAMRGAEQYGFAQLHGQATYLRGSILVMLGHSEEGLRELRQGLAIYESTGAVLDKPHSLGLLAEAYGQNQQFAEGLDTVTKAISIAEHTGELYYGAELYRIKGELLLARESQGQRAGSEQKARGKKSETRTFR
jgi:predicted ATPase